MKYPPRHVYEPLPEKPLVSGASMRLVATCAAGLEEILEGELRALGMEGVRRERGAVRFAGRWSDCWRANWRLATANRVLVELTHFDAPDGDALAAGAAKLVGQGWRRFDGLSADDLFNPRRTFALQATARASKVTDSRWVVLKVKDGLVDGQRARFRQRSSVDRDRPDVPLRVWLFQDHASILLDTSGEPLDRRGYRVQTVEAPVRENLAAACVLASGWDGRGPVVDPMCGSGTLLAEAAFFALGRAPGSVRRGWAFERLPSFRPRVFERIRRELIPAPGPGVRLYGVDNAPEALAAARANLERAGLAGRATLSHGDAYDQEPPTGASGEKGLLLVNPAYGERLEEEPDQWSRLGDLLKQRYTGWRAVVLAGGESLGKHIGLRTSRRLPVRNGPLDARILVFELY